MTADTVGGHMLTVWLNFSKRHGYGNMKFPGHNAAFTGWREDDG